MTPRAEELVRLALVARVHDGPLQLLLAARQDLQELPGEEARAAQELVGRAVRELRALLCDEVSDTPGNARLVLEDWCALLARTYDFGWTVTVDPGLGEVDPLVLAAARELVSNAAKHARATHVRVSVLRIPDVATVVEVRDDGIGIAPGTALGFGLCALRRRLRAAGGDVTVTRQTEGSLARAMVR